MRRVLRSSQHHRRMYTQQRNATVSDVLGLAVRRGVFDAEAVEAAPVAMFYDLDAYESLLRECRAAFPSFRHFVAAKANPLPSVLARALSHGFGIECASIGELLLATEELGAGVDDVVFDSPAKTKKELRFAMERNIRTHLDNFAELDRAVDVLRSEGASLSSSSSSSRKLGFRVNPSNAETEGTIASLNVSTPDSKFGVDLQCHWEELVEAYAESPFLDSVHVHVGSGMGGERQLAAGVRATLDFARAVNDRVPRRIRFVDIGGGLPVNYLGEGSKISFESYAAVLRETCPELFDPEAFEGVFTEFGQSLNAKAGFLASRVEFVKKEPTRRNHLAVVHFGADLCVRQAYGGADHPRRFAVFDHDGKALDDDGAVEGAAAPKKKNWSVGGPLCFQGDFVAKDLALPENLQAGDFVVMKDAGANTLSLFSRHCSRFAPPVYGFRRDARGRLAQDLVELKPRETLDGLASFWTGRQHLADRQAFIQQHKQPTRLEIPADHDDDDEIPADDDDDDEIPAAAAASGGH